MRWLCECRERACSSQPQRVHVPRTHLHTGTQTHRKTRGHGRAHRRPKRPQRGPRQRPSRESMPSRQFGANACALLEMRSFSKITFTQLQVSLSSYMEMALSNAATSHGTDLGVRWWVGFTGPRRGAASRASIVRNRRSCWAPQLLLALAGLLPTCGAGEESNGTNSPKCTVC